MAMGSCHPTILIGIQLSQLGYIYPNLNYSNWDPPTPIGIQLSQLAFPSLAMHENQTILIWAPENELLISITICYM